MNTDIQAPERFTYPCCYEPHPLCVMAAKEVQTHIGSHAEIREDADQGKMFGVLVVEHADGLAYLAAYSGLLAGRNDWDYFVVPLYENARFLQYNETSESETEQGAGSRIIRRKLVAINDETGVAHLKVSDVEAALKNSRNE